jgi:CheY-like chemotaxis protein
MTGSAAVPARIEHAIAANEPRTPTILIVDDNPADRRLIQEALALLPMGCATQELTTGDAALQLADAVGADPGMRVPDLLITDLHLPCVTGIDVVRAFRANPALALVPALVLSGSASPDDRATLGSLPGVSFAEKPEDLDSLTAVGDVIRTILCGSGSTAIN